MPTGLGSASFAVDVVCSTTPALNVSDTQTPACAQVILPTIATDRPAVHPGQDVQLGDEDGEQAMSGMAIII